MAARASMTEIIAFVRELIQDPAGADQKFTDDQIQMRLDMTRLDKYQACLHSADTLTPLGSIEWHDFFAKAPSGYWESDYIIQKVNGELAPPDTAELAIGKFHYIDHQPTPLVITGRVYNVYGVAVKLLTTWKLDLRSQISSWTADGTTVQKANQLATMADLIASYAGMAWGWGGGAYSQIKLVRKDLRN